WIGYQFPTAVTLREVTLQCEFAGTQPTPNPMAAPQSFVVEYSLDGSGWTGVYTAANNYFWNRYNSGSQVASEARIFTFGITPQFFRLSITANSGAGNQWI